MMTREAGSTYWRGSARSLGGFDIIEAFRQHGHLFVEFGGHTQAAGFSIKQENIPLLRQQLNEYAARLMPCAEMAPEIYFDGVAEGGDIGAELLGSLEQMEPCGEGNPETLFMMENVTLVDSRNLGLENQHWKFRVSSGGQQHECIGFYLGDQSGQFEVGDQLDILFHPEWNHFNGEARIQMRIRDVRRCVN
jgi:single-stranded-DNA-specific exonuclease